MSKDKILGDEQIMVVFLLAGERYAVTVSQIKEVIKLPSITSVPESPPYVEGIINIRGATIPVVNLKRRLFLITEPVNSNTRIMIAEIEGRTVGLIVDEVSEIRRMDTRKIQATPSLLEKGSSHYVRGIFYDEQTMYIIIDLENVLSNNQMQSITSGDEHNSNLALTGR